MGCCLSTEQQVAAILRKFPVASFDSIQSSDLPQLIIGRILPTTNPLTSPVRNKQCVYYNVCAYEVEGTDGESKVLRFIELIWQDFILYDPRFPHATQVFVPTNVCIRVRGTNDGKGTSGTRSVSLFQSETLPEISKLLRRNNFNGQVNTLIGKRSKRMLYIEESFGIGEVVACLGIVKDGMTPDGRPIKILTPMKGDLLTKAYFDQHAWRGIEKQIWIDLLGPDACLIASDDPAVFQGVMIPGPIPPPPHQQSLQYPVYEQMHQSQQQQPMASYPSHQYQQPPQSSVGYPNPFASPHQVFPAPTLSATVPPQQSNHQKQKKNKPKQKR